MPQHYRTKHASWTWYIAETTEDLGTAMRHRVTTATRFLTDRIRRNISKPVGDGNRRSRPGEFPRADTKKLMQTLHSDFKATGSTVYEGFSVMVQPYGLELELEMNRSFMVRTFTEMEPIIRDILIRPIRGGGAGRLITRRSTRG